MVPPRASPCVVPPPCRWVPVAGGDWCGNWYGNRCRDRVVVFAANRAVAVISAVVSGAGDWGWDAVEDGVCAVSM